MEKDLIEKNVISIYEDISNNLKTTKEYAPVIVSVLQILKETREPISIQSALNILDDVKCILQQITKV
jgi:hypothetical protein